MIPALCRGLVFLERRRLAGVHDVDVLRRLLAAAVAVLFVEDESKLGTGPSFGTERDVVHVYCVMIGPREWPGGAVTLASYIQPSLIRSVL